MRVRFDFDHKSLRPLTNSARIRGFGLSRPASHCATISRGFLVFFCQEVTCCDLCWGRAGAGAGGWCGSGASAAATRRRPAEGSGGEGAIDAVKATEAQTIADQIRFCEIPAPSIQGRGPRPGAEARVHAARPAERARRQGGQRARRVCRRGARTRTSCSPRTSTRCSRKGPTSR